MAEANIHIGECKIKYVPAGIEKTKAKTRTLKVKCSAY